MSSKIALGIFIGGTFLVPVASRTELSASSQATSTQKPVAQGAAERASADAAFITQAEEGGMKEVDAATLAQGRRRTAT